MAIAHALSGEVVDLQGPATPERTTALFKAPDLEAMRLVLPAGKQMPPHSVAGSVTVHCLAGRIELQLPDAAVQLAAGQLVYLAGGVTHGVRALEDAQLLVTLAIGGAGA